MPNKAETFARSETHINLMRAFAGESQARNRYTIAAGMAREKNLYVVQQAFLFTADQELTHAKQFYRQLADLSGQTVRADGTYPVDLYPDLLSHLRAAQNNEFQEWEHDYAHFADVAREEGFSEIAKTFDMIADIEKVHGDRFGRFADLLESEKLFVSDIKVQWMCLNCGMVIESTRAPAMCPVCKHDQGWFIRMEMVPFH